MIKEQVPLEACEAFVDGIVDGGFGAALLLHALLTTDWSDARTLVKDGHVWVDVTNHLWSAYADRDGEAVRCLFGCGVLQKLPEQYTEDWTFVRPTDNFIEKFGLNRVWFSK